MRKINLRIIIIVLLLLSNIPFALSITSSDYGFEYTEQGEIFETYPMVLDGQPYLLFIYPDNMVVFDLSNNKPLFDSLREEYKEAREVLNKLNTTKEIKEKVVSKIKESKEYHTVKNRAKIKKLEEEIGKINIKVAFQQHVVNYTPRQQHENAGLAQIISSKENTLIKTKKIMQLIKDTF